MGARMPVNLWQAAVLAALLAAAAVGAYLALSRSNSGGELGLAENEQLVAAQIGDLRSEVSTNGSVVFPNTSTERFGSTGVVGEVLVEAGDAVTEGQVLASLDDASVNALGKAILEARSELADAREALEAALEPPTALDRATARSRVAVAARKVRNAEDALAGLLSTIDDIDLSEARNGLQSARIALDNASEDLVASSETWETKELEARSAADDATAGYKEVLSRWLGVAASPEDLQKPVGQLLAEWNIDLAALFEPDPTQTADVARGPYSSGPPPDDPGTPWSEPTIYAWLNFFPGSIAVTCDDSYSGQIPCILRELEDASDAAAGARDALADVQAQAVRAQVAAEAAVAKARDALTRAEEKLAALQEDPDPLNVQVAEADLDVARESLAAEQEALQNLDTPPDPAAVDLLRAEVDEADAALDAALDRLGRATLKAPFDGFVSAVNIEPGDAANTNQAAVLVVDPTQAEVDGIVDEIDALSVSIGAAATVTMDALPDTPLAGTVSFVGFALDDRQNVVAYPIRIRIDLPPGVALRTGLSATADVVISEHLGVLLIPTQALRGGFTDPFVLVHEAGVFGERSVQLGDSDDFWVQVTEGLAEGEEVVMQVAEGSEDLFTIFRGAGPPVPRRARP